MSIELFQLLPAIHRLRDGQIAATMDLLTVAEKVEVATLEATPSRTTDQQARLDKLLAKAMRGPLESLLRVIDEQMNVFDASLDQLYEDQFLETCDPWVIPYLADLIGYTPLHGIPAEIDNPRAEVANTISMRRRKGTALVLEELARDITGWGAHVVEFFTRLRTDQYMKHVRLQSKATPDVRSWRTRAYAESGFTLLTRSPDVRNPVSPGHARPQVTSLGIYLWSLGAYSWTNISPAPSVANTPGRPLCYRFHPLGIDAHLFHAAQSQGETVHEPSTEVNVPDVLSRRLLCDDLRQGVATKFYGQGSSLAIVLDGQLLNPYQIQVADLSGLEGAWKNLPADSTYAVTVDPELGRMALPASAGAPALSVSFQLGFNGAMGSGEYERRDSFEVKDAAAVLPYPDTAAVPRYSTLADALAFAVGLFGVHGKVAVEIGGSLTEELPAALETIDLPNGKTLELRARNLARPVLLLQAPLVITGGEDSNFFLNGVVVGAAPGFGPSAAAPALVYLPSLRPDTTHSRLASANLTHATLVPGWSLGTDGTPNFPAGASVQAEADGVQVLVAMSITGPVRAVPGAVVQLTDSILDATARDGIAYADIDGESGGGSLTLVGTTVVGRVHAHDFELISNSIVWATFDATWTTGLRSDHLQHGCVRFSFLPVGAVTPKRYRCVEEDIAGPIPLFEAVRYGRPGYLKLFAGTPDSIRKGADDGGEMGAWNFVGAPLRESDLLVRLEEYLPAGLTVSLIYET